MTEQPSSPPPTDRPVPPSDKPGRLTLTGTVRPGVEADCLLLQGYLLVGGPRDLLHGGGRVKVTGRVQPDLMTTCQQGTPFVVEAAEPA